MNTEKYQEYLEAGSSGSMRTSNLIHSDLTASGPSTLTIFFTLETKGFPGGFLLTEENKAAGRFGKITYVHCLD
jgi:hypothetical protein